MDFCSLFVSRTVPYVIQVVVVTLVADLAVSVLLIRYWLLEVIVVPRLRVIVSLDSPNLLLSVLSFAELFNGCKVLRCILLLRLGDTATVALGNVFVKFMGVIVRPEPILLRHGDQISVQLTVQVTCWRCFRILLIFPELVCGSHL